MAYADMFLGSAAVGFIASFFILFILLIVGLYVYSSLALMKIAKRTHTSNEWFAWLPILSTLLQLNIAKMHWAWIFVFIAPILLVFIPILGWILIIPFLIASLVLFIFIWWKICEARKKPGWLALFLIIMYIPIINFIGGIFYMVLIGILAWGKK